MTSFQQLWASQRSVEEAIQQKLASRGQPSDPSRKLDDASAYNSDPLLSALAGSPSMRGHAADRARELSARHLEQVAADQLAHEQALRRGHAIEMKAVKLQADAAKQDADESRRQLQAAQQECASLQSKNVSLSSESERYAARLRTLQSEGAESSAAAAAAESTNAQLRVRLDELERSLSSERGTMSRRANDLENALESSQLEVHELKQQLADAEKGLTECRCESRKAEQSAAADVAELRGALAKAQNEGELLRHAASDAAASDSVAGAQVSKLRDAHVKLKADLREAESLLRRSDQDRCALDLLPAQCALLQEPCQLWARKACKRIYRLRSCFNL